MAQTSAEGVTVGKLVRDRIPEIIEADGRTANVRQLADEEYGAALLDKLSEEVQELCDATPVERLGEAADVYEVLLALVEHIGLSYDDLVRAADEKRRQRGGFSRRLWWDGDGGRQLGRRSKE
jgi:predicted house-cleaning noncanonical NTP pyrophosphatase (MazG superfamily)